MTEVVGAVIESNIQQEPSAPCDVTTKTRNTGFKSVQLHSVLSAAGRPPNPVPLIRFPVKGPPPSILILGVVGKDGVCIRRTGVVLIPII